VVPARRWLAGLALTILVPGLSLVVWAVRTHNPDLFVTSGIGTSIVPVRFRVPPEISLITVDRR